MPPVPGLPAPESRAPGRALLERLGLAVASFALCAAAIEVSARVVAHRRQARPRREPSFLVYDPDLGWRKAAGEQQWLYDAGTPVLFRVNSHGLRGPDRGYDKPEAVTRVLLLGDSFAEAGAVAEEDSLRAVLERELDGGGCTRYEVINGGTSGYSTDQEYLFFQNEGWRYGPDVVVLLFFSNDLDGNTSRRKKPWFELDGGRLALRNEPVPAPPAEHRRRARDASQKLTPWHGSYALRLLGERTQDGNPRLHRLLAGMGLVPPAPDHPPTRDWLLSYGPDTPTTERRWEVTLALLDALRSSVEAHRARFAVLYVPAGFEEDERDWERTRDRWGLEGDGWDRTRVRSRLQAACRSRGIVFVDPSDGLAEAQAAGRRAYLRSDPHWTAAGHAAAAAALAPAVRSSGGCLALRAAHAPASAVHAAP